MDWLGADHSNLLSALRYFVTSGDVESAVRMVGGLWRFWWRRGFLTEGRSRTDEVLALFDASAPGLLQANALLAAGLLALWQADYDEARRLLRVSTDMARGASDQRCLAYGLVFLGRVARDLGEAGAAELSEEGVALFRQVGDEWGLGVGLHFLGLAIVQTDVSRARDCFQESIAIFGPLGGKGDIAMPFRGMGLLSYLNGEFAQARQYFEESASLFRSNGDAWSSSMVMHDLGSVAEAQGSIYEAAAFLSESLRTWRELGNKRGSLICLAGFVRVALRLGVLDLAVQLIAAIETLLADAHIALEPTDGTSLHDGLAQARSRLRAAEFAAAWQKGAGLSFEAAIALGFSVEDIVKSLGSKGRMVARPSDELSPREREVAALLPLGMTNRQIADRLTITEGTANLHVKHILAKLGFTSRAQIAAWVVQQGVEDVSRADPASL